MAFNGPSHKRSRPLVHVTGALGGIETYLRLFLEHYPLHLRTVAFVLPGQCDLAERAQELGLRCHFLPLRREISLRSDLASAWYLRSILQNYERPIVHLHSSKAGAMGRLACATLSGVSVVYTPNAFAYLGGQGLRRSVLLRVERWLRPFTTCLAAASVSEARRAISDVGYAPDKVTVVPNSVECEGIRSVDRPPPGPPVILYVGRIAEQKNVEMLLRVARRLVKLQPAVRFRIIGTGFYQHDRARLTQLRARFGLNEDQVEEVPWIKRDQLLEEMYSAHVVVLTSRYESFGYVLAEASTRGIPVVGTRVDGISEIIRDGENGFLVDVDDDERMLAALVRLVQDEELWRRMSANGPRHVHSNFDIRRNIERFESLYARL